MVIHRVARELTLVQQALGLRHDFPEAATELSRSRLMWTAIICPTPLSRNYKVRIRYQVGAHPKVVVLDPPLVPDERGLLPHFYRDGSICLHDIGQWRG
jgi:hypothetical protein